MIWLRLRLSVCRVPDALKCVEANTENIFRLSYLLME